MEIKSLSVPYCYFSTKSLILYNHSSDKLKKNRNEILGREGRDRVLLLSTGDTF